MHTSPPKFSATANASDELIETLYKAPTQRHVLSNGLTLVQRPDFSSEVVSVQVWVKTGSIHESALLGSGLSHFLEHMLFKGTTRRNGKAISREVHAMGGSINAYTTFDRTVYYINAPSTAFEAVLDILADIVFHSTLPEVEVERERDVILREIDMGLDDPDRQLSQALFRTAFSVHPYREPVIGHRELYQQVSGQELRAYYRARYVPNNVVVSIAGAVSATDCLREVEKCFGSIPRGRLSPVPVESEPVQLAARREVIVGDYNVSRGGIGFKVPHLSHPASPHLDALAHALGGGESSLLWERLRNQQNLVHYIDCRNWNPGEQGLFWISYLCDPEKQPQVEQAIHALLAETAECGFSEDAVEKARRQALSSEINGRKTMSGQASRLGLGEVVVGDLHYGRRYLKRLQAVGVGDLQQALQRYLLEETCSSVMIGPKLEGAVVCEDAAQTLSPAPFESIVFESGARLLLQQDARLPKVHLRCVLLAGPLYEPSNQRGVSELLAELMTRDTQRHSAPEISSLIECIGGSFYASGGNNTINLSLEVLPADLPLALELLADALTCPIFAEDTFETEREAQIAGLKEEDDEILNYGIRKLRERFFGAHPFSVAADGRIQDLEQLDRAGVAAHFERIVRASNVVLSVCGDFDAALVRSALQPLLEDKLSALPFEPIQQLAIQGPEKPLDLHEPMAREQSVVLYGFPDFGIKHPDYVVGEVLNELFSGMSSRLFESVREDKGMAYYVGSTRIVGLEAGMFLFYAGTHPSQAQDVLAEIIAEIARVAAGEVLEDELARCRTRLKAARKMGRQTIGARAMHAAIQATYELPLDDDAEYSDQLDRVTIDTLAAHAGEYFAAARGVRMVVGPTEPNA